MNEIINVSFNKIDSIDEERKKTLTYSLLKASVIKSLYSSGFSLEELSAFTGLNIESILKYLDSKQIKHRIEDLRINLLNKHPLSSIF